MNKKKDDIQEILEDFDSSEDENILDSSAIPKIDVSNLEPDDDNIEIIGSSNKYSLTMYLDPNSEDRYITKFIRAVEKLVRSNKDYNFWLTSIRDDEFLSKDAFLSNFTSDKVEIQLHHYPLNLYTICSCVCNKMISEGKKVSTFFLADEVIKYHLDGMIGLVPLTTTMHELAHLDKLPIQRNQIYGKWEKFVNEYIDYLGDYEKNLIRNLLNRKSIDANSSVFKTIGYTNDDGSI